jgi:hypothetical protein
MQKGLRPGGGLFVCQVGGATPPCNIAREIAKLGKSIP